MTYQTSLEEIVQDLEDQIAKASSEDREVLMPKLRALLDAGKQPTLRHRCKKTEADDDLLFDNIPV